MTCRNAKLRHRALDDRVTLLSQRYCVVDGCHAYRMNTSELCLRHWVEWKDTPDPKPKERENEALLAVEKTDAADDVGRSDEAD